MKIFAYMLMVCLIVTSFRYWVSQERGPVKSPISRHVPPLVSKRPEALRCVQAPFPVNGSVEIELEVEQPSQCIVLHAAGMDITHAALLEPEHTHGAHNQVGWASKVSFLLAMLAHT